MGKQIRIGQECLILATALALCLLQDSTIPASASEELNTTQFVETVMPVDELAVWQPNQSFDPPVAPYSIRQLVEPGTGWQQSDPVVTSNGDTVRAAVVSNLPGYAICLLIDRSSDGLIDNVLPTGISSGYSSTRWEAAGTTEYRPDGQPQPLMLEMPDGSTGRLSLSHYSYEYRNFGSAEVLGQDDYRPVLAWHTVELDLGMLEQDSDADGLTDIAEQYFFTDPVLADSDGDGLDDRHDRFPNVNPASLGSLSCNVSDVLEQLLQEEFRLPADAAGLVHSPQSALAPLYLLSHGVGPLILPGAGYCQVVCLDTAALHERFSELNAQATSASQITLQGSLLAGVDGQTLETDRILFDGRVAVRELDAQLWLQAAFGTLSFETVLDIQDGLPVLPANWQDTASGSGDYIVCYEMSDL